MPKQKYYHSRKRYMPCLYPLDLMHRAYFRSSEYYGFTFTKIVSVNVRGNLEFLHTMHDIRTLRRKIMDRIHREPTHIRRANQRMLGVNANMERDIGKQFMPNSSGLSIREFVTLFDRVNRYHEEILKYSWLPIPILPDYCSDLLIRELRKRMDDAHAGEVFQRVTTPMEPSIVSRQITDLLELAESIRHELPKPSWHAANNNPKVLRNIRVYHRKYAWAPVNYHNRPWSVFDIWRQAAAILKRRNSVGVYGNGVESDATQRETDFVQLSPSARLYSQLIRDVAILQDNRKALVTKVHCYTNQILDTVARKQHSTIGEFWWLTTEEIRALLTGNASIEDMKTRIRERKSIWALTSTPECNELLTGGKARLFHRQIVADSGFQKSTIRGMCASKGHAKGTVRIVLKMSDMHGMQDGDILVSTMTTPDLVPAMRKAAAIVTDEGGITCHAAIVSRELGIPCVVGTKNATDLLRNGEVVAVDADKGVVTRIN